MRRQNSVSRTSGSDHDRSNGCRACSPLSARKVVADELQEGRKWNLQGSAHGRQQFAGRFLLASFDLGEVSVGHAGRLADIAQGAALLESKATKLIADDMAHEHRASGGAGDGGDGGERSRSRTGNRTGRHPLTVPRRVVRSSAARPRRCNGTQRNLHNDTTTGKHDDTTSHHVTPQSPNDFPHPGEARLGLVAPVGVVSVVGRDHRQYQAQRGDDRGRTNLLAIPHEV